MARTTAIFLLISAAVLLLSSADAFTMQPSRTSSMLKMSDGGNQEDVQSKISADGTFYDDELDSAPIKTGISDSMRQRLMAEASTGLDSEKPQTNVILYIGVFVALLVALGGSGILY